jgi:hypothetical protein
MAASHAIEHGDVWRGNRLDVAQWQHVGMTLVLTCSPAMPDQWEGKMAAILTQWFQNR